MNFLPFGLLILPLGHLCILYYRVTGAATCADGSCNHSLVEDDGICNYELLVCGQQGEKCCPLRKCDNAELECQAETETCEMACGREGLPPCDVPDGATALPLHIHLHSYADLLFSCIVSTSDLPDGVLATQKSHILQGGSFVTKV